jgi:hypothetical protein
MRYAHILWCNEGKHDKVWGVICLYEPEGYGYSNGKFLTVWGRRGAKLQTKLWTGSNYEAEELARKKLRGEYEEVDQRYLDEVYPDFQQDLEKTAFWATFKI